VPSELQRILTKALRKPRDMRYQSATDLMIDLKNLKQELEVGDRLKVASTSTADAGLTGIEITNAASAGRSTNEETQRHVVYPTSSAEYLVGELKRHKRGMFIIIASLIGAAILSWYMVSRRAKIAQPIDSIDSVAVLPFV